MTELNSRIIIGLGFLSCIYFSIKSSLFYSFWIISLFILSQKELFQFTKVRQVYMMMFLQLYVIYLTIFKVSREDILTIIIYNSTSDAFQYFFGKIFGKVRPFRFTSKSLEGYIGGLLCTYWMYNFGPIYPILNVIGMIGGMISSIIKRNIGIKHWGNLLGAHGGINDRLDSIILPIIFYYYLEY